LTCRKAFGSRHEASNWRLRRTTSTGRPCFGPKKSSFASDVNRPGRYCRCSIRGTKKAMSILVNQDTKVITQGITGKTGQFHTRMCRDYANGRNCFVAGVNPKKPGENFEGIPIYATVKEAKAATGATVSVVYVPPPFAAAAIDE